MRQFAYQTKSQEDADTWSPMLVVEKSFLEGAQTEWNEVLPLWDGKQDALQSIFQAAWTEAKDDTIDLLAERIPNIENLLGGLEVSMGDLTVGAN